MKVDPDDFEAWLANPITEALMKRASTVQEKCKEEWFLSSWGKPIDQLKVLSTDQLAYLRGKADAYKSLSKLEYKDLFKESTTDVKQKKDND